MEGEMTDQPLKLGSSVIPLYVERQMKVYAVTEGEFNSLSTQNTQMTIYVMVGFAILSAAVSIWVNALFYTDVPPSAYVAKIYVAPFFILLALVCFLLAWHVYYARSSTWAAIRSESGIQDG